MNVAPVYALRDRLRAVLVAGVSLSEDDFRLKRDLDQFAPLEQAAPVFSRLGQICRAAMAPDCPDRAGTLLEAISLADAVLCTLATAGIPGEVMPVSVKNGPLFQSTIPYSVLAPLKDALLSQGSGTYTQVLETHDAHPELFRDFRLQRAMVQALGAKNANLANSVQEILSGMGEELIPFLYDGFDPGGKKDMARRVQIISHIAGAEANEFYLVNLSEAGKEVRPALIYAMRQDPGNAEALISLFRTEKGPAKKAAGYALARMEAPAVRAYWTQSAKTKELALQYADLSTTPTISMILAEALGHLLEPFEADPDTPLVGLTLDTLAERLLPLLPGKSGPAICSVYRRMVALAPVLERKPAPHPGFPFPTVMFRIVRDGKRVVFSEALAGLLWRSLLIHPAPDLIALAEELSDSAGGYFRGADLAATMLTRPAEEVWARAEPLFCQSDSEDRTFAETILAQLVGSLELDESGRTGLTATFQDPAAGGSKETPVFCPLYEEPDLRFYRALFSHDWDMSTRKRIYHLIPSRQDIRELAGECLYQALLRAPEIVQGDVECLRRIGWKTCAGLGVHFCLTWPRPFHLFSLQMFLGWLPGDRAAKQAEARAVYDLIVQGKAQLVGDLALLKETIDLLQDEPFTNINQLPDGSYS